MPDELNDSFYRIRPFVDTDAAYITATWIDSHQESVCGKDHGPFYRKGQTSLIRAILKKPSTVVKVACDLEDANAIHGWSVTAPSKGILYYVYVKGASRKLGVARNLVDVLYTPDVIYTHRPSPSMALKPRRGWRYNYFANFDF